MLLITWNCNGAFRKKYENLLDFDADILVIQECEDPALVQDEGFRERAGNFLWTGDSKHKGLGVFAKKDIRLEPLDWGAEHEGVGVKHFLPCRVNGKFDILGVWAHYNNSPTYGYIGQLWKYLQVNKSNFQDIIITGDYNSNAIWDRKSRWWNHSDVVVELREMDIHSAYHIYNKEEHGKETRPTFYLHRNENKPYHIDYLFASAQILNTMEKITVGSYAEWKHLSDHVPVMVTWGDF